MIQVYFSLEKFSSSFIRNVAIPCFITGVKTISFSRPYELLSFYSPTTIEHYLQSFLLEWQSIGDYCLVIIYGLPHPNNLRLRSFPWELRNLLKLRY